VSEGALLPDPLPVPSLLLLSRAHCVAATLPVPDPVAEGTGADTEMVEVGRADAVKHCDTEPATVADILSDWLPHSLLLPCIVALPLLLHPPLPLLPLFVDPTDTLPVSVAHPLLLPDAVLSPVCLPDPLLLPDSQLLLVPPADWLAQLEADLPALSLCLALADPPALPPALPSENGVPLLLAHPLLPALADPHALSLTDLFPLCVPRPLPLALLHALLLLLAPGTLAVPSPELLPPTLPVPLLLLLCRALPVLPSEPLLLLLAHSE
jgi:hypothetical protein